MRFELLELRAFGPFTDRRLRFAPPGVLTLVLGANEAGKSSTLRAMQSLLFGFDERTPDNFMHEYRALRVGATVTLADGRTLHLMRRKQRRNTLFEWDPASGEELTATPLDDDLPRTLLGALDAVTFRRLYGLDIDDLERGGQALVEGEGDLGRSLFQAAAGLAGLRQVGTELEERANELFRPRATTSAIHRTLRVLTEGTREVRERSVRASAWTEQERELRRQLAEVQRLRDALGQARDEHQRLERIRACLPLALQVTQSRALLATLADVPALSPEAAERRVRGQEQMRTAELERTAADRLLDELAAQVAAVQIEQGLLDQAGEVERLHHAAQARREVGLRQAPLRQAVADGWQQMGVLLAEIGLPSDEPAIAALQPGARGDALAAWLQPQMPAPTLLARLDALAIESSLLEQRAAELAGQADDHRRELAALRARADAAAPAGDPLLLEQACADAQAEGDIERRVQALTFAHDEARAELERAARALSPLPLDALLEARGPLAADIDFFEQRFRALQADEQQRAADLATLERDLAQCGRELQQLAAGGPVPTTDDLADSRLARDRLWQAIRGRYIDEPRQPAGDDPTLPERFETAQRQADRQADSLNEDIGRATRAAELRRRIGEMETARTAHREAAARQAQALTSLEREWQRLAAPLGDPVPRPEAAREWLRRQQTIVQQAATLRRQQAELAAQQATVRMLRQRLAALLPGSGGAQSSHAGSGLGASLADLLQQAQRVRAEHDMRRELARRLEEAHEAGERLRGRTEQLDTDSARWRTDWSRTVAALRLDGSALPAEVRVGREQFDRLGRELAALRRDEAALLAAERQTADYDRALAAVLDAMAAASPRDDPADVARQLYQRLQAQRAALQTLQQAQAARQQALQRRHDADERLARARAELDELMREARASSLDELPAIEERDRQRRAGQQALAGSIALLTQTGARPLDELLAETAGVDPDSLGRRLREGAETMVSLEHALEAAQQSAIERRRQLAGIDGRADASDAAQRLREHEALLAAQLRDYAHNRIASRMLERVIGIYRDRHQGPLLSRASQAFAAITLGAFVRLVTDHDETRQVLLAERADGRRLTVAALSQGTRHQLFLALRIAAIESRLDDREPVPVIIDDLLVQFDDERSAATVRVLAQLAGRTQVVYFTHHRHLAELAQRTLGQQCEIRRLDAEVSTATAFAGDTPMLADESSRTDR